MSRALRRVLLAWVMEGRSPTYHRKKKAQLRAEWPSLADALDALVLEGRR